LKGRIIKILKIVLPLGIGVYLTWYFLSGLTDKDLQQTKDAFFNANYLWIFISLVIAFSGHLSRAYRWLFLLEPLGYKPKLSNAYHAVMSGYIINYTVPRSGEVARAGLLTQSENIPFEKGFATIVVERIIDVLMLGGVVLITTILQTNSDQFEKIMDSGGTGDSMLIWYILGAGLLFGLVGLGIYFKSERIKKWVNEKLLGFWEGIKSVWTMKRKWSFAFHTLFIWATYIGMMWTSAMAFEETKDIPVEAILGAFVVGAAAIAILPGGIGVYPLWVTAVLGIYDIDFAAFGIFVWSAQTLLILVLGLISLAILQWRKNT
jgi:uncharacterized protein (TIRG00374 family)